VTSRPPIRTREVDYALAGLPDDVDPCAEAVSPLAARLAKDVDSRTALNAPYDAPAIFAAARRRDRLAGAVVEELARRIALHIRRSPPSPMWR
jgi:hypothetical protein